MVDGFHDPAYSYQKQSQLAEEPDEVPGQLPFDPVLRLALIKKGVITPDDLVSAEKEIKVVSAAFASDLLQEIKNGNPES